MEILRGSFSWALVKLKEGYAVTRHTGWNGKNMFIYLVAGSEVSPEKLRNEAFTQVRSRIIAEMKEGEESSSVNIRPHIDMRDAQGDIAVGWVPSQADMFAKDWMIKE